MCHARPAARAMDVGDKVATVRCASQGTEHFETTANVTALHSITAVRQSRDYHVWRLATALWCCTACCSVPRTRTSTAAVSPRTVEE